MATGTAHSDTTAAGDGLLECVVVTPERTLFDERVEFVALPLYDGEIGLLPGHTPLIGRLGYGELRTRMNGITARYFVDGGFVQVRDDVVTVLTHQALPVAQIDLESSSVALEEARTRRATTPEEVEEKSRAISRARAMVRAASPDR